MLPEPGTVRAATFEVFRTHGLTTMFSNPGSTEVPFLAGLPADLRFVLALHEASAVGMATGFALARERAALVLLHTTAGLGNAVSALATARVNRAPLVVVVGQQDRRHLAHQPFLTGRLDGLAGDYPVWTDQPVRAQDVPGAIARAVHEATTHAGPAIVHVPMDDWSAPFDGTVEPAAATRVLRPRGVDPGTVDALVAFLRGARRPALVVGAGAASDSAWAALVTLAERTGAAVWQEPFGARPGFPGDHPAFAGQLAADRGRLRAQLEPHDAVLVVGTGAFRQYAFAPGPLTGADTRVAVVSADPDEVHRSPSEVAVLGDPAAVCGALAARMPDAAPARPAAAGAPGAGAPAGEAAAPPGRPTAAPAPLQAADVFAALAARLPADAIVVEESPSNRADLERLLPARTPLGFVSAAMGGLGFALPAAIGLRMGAPDRPVVALVGDGSSLYQIQALWSAAQEGVGALLVILDNGRYAIMDRLAAGQGGAAPWPALNGIDLEGLAAAFGCPVTRIRDHAELNAELDATVPGLRDATSPRVLVVSIAAELSPLQPAGSTPQ